jgi:hypothetical protein
MKILTAAVKSFIAAFITFVFVDGLLPLADRAKDLLEATFERLELELADSPEGEQTSEPGDTKFIRVRKAGIKCPLALKQVFATNPVRILGFVLIPDMSLVKTLAQLKSFCSAYLKGVETDEDFDNLIISAAGRMIATDLRNTFAQKALRKEEQAEKDSQKIAAFVTMDETIWQGSRTAFLAGKNEAMDELVELIDEARAARAKNLRQSA